ncbi:MAG: c-type cytochrome, partial [bacterium]
MLCSDRAAAAPTVAGFERFGRQAADRPQVVESGLLLLGELGCVNCHAPQPSQAVHLLPKRGPSLDRVGERLDPQWIAAYLKDPRARVPHTTMPHALAAVPASSRDDVAAALTHFLASTGQFGSATSAARQPGNAAEGAAIFNRIGCAACHGRRDAASLLPDQIPLHGLEAKWDPSSLDRFLRDPLSVRPSSRMPALAMKDHESSHLVA